MNRPIPPFDAVVIRRAAPSDFPVIGDLARLIWRHSFPGMITTAQIEYMLAQRYTPEAMAAAVASGLSFELLLVDAQPLAFAAHGPTRDPAELKLHQLYVHPDWQRRGLGGLLIDHVETLAKALGRRTLVLTVNRHNQTAQAAYLRRGFTVCAEVKFDIGQGYVMDDYVMQKRLDGPEAPAASPAPPSPDH